MDKHRLAINSVSRKRRRLEVLLHYGGKCVCCGEDRWRYLEFDHVDGNGSEHRKIDKVRTGDMAKWCKDNDYPQSIQILCISCNKLKGTSSTCPCSEETNTVKEELLLLPPVNTSPAGRGSSNKRARFTEEDVVKLREVYSTGTTSIRKLAAEYNVDPSTIWNIVKRLTWKHV